jgi:REP element-mobilizing transposase RayT
MQNRAQRKECLKATRSDLHVYNRGVDRGTIFFKKEDYLDFLELAEQALEGSGITIVLHTLMPTHFHFVVRQDHPYDISAFLKRICERHAMKINKMRSRTGHLFQGRFKISRINDPGSLLRLSRYIHFNAVGAKLVKRPIDWPFSSIKDYAGLVRSGLVTTEPILNLVGGEDAYMQFLQEYNPNRPDSVWKYLLRARSA